MAYILFENRKTMCNQANSHYFYGDYSRIVCTRPEEVKNCLKKIENSRLLGKYIVGYISYEASYCLSKVLVTSYKNSSNLPLIDFYIFEKHKLLKQSEVEFLLKEMVGEYDNDEAFIYNVKLNFNMDTYSSCLEQIKKHIKEGDTYQVNFTGRYKFQLQGAPIRLYQQLRERQKVEFSAYINCGEIQLLSFSPELFFEKRGEYFRSRPMKGTMPRSTDSEIDTKNKNRLLNDPKIIAENMIIVDLIRNDLSIIAQPKSVNVPKLLEVEKYETVYQMTSTITCNIDKEMGFSDIISSIFPCGSITGAPKMKTMQIIRKLEEHDRGIYTGAIGYITPQNDMCFNVAIRTLNLINNIGEMGVGGGIVHDSIIEDEFEEAKTKARFLTELSAPFNLIECFLYEAKIGFRYLDDHFNRLSTSAKVFNFKFLPQEIFKKLMEEEKKLDPIYSYKIKIILEKEGGCNIISTRFDNQITNNKIKLLSSNIKTRGNILFRHKTDAKSVRGVYDKFLACENFEQTLFDVVFMNEDGFITEGSKSNIFISKQGVILTPAINCGVLGGIMRKKFIMKNPQVKEAFLKKEDLLEADTIWMTNSIVGIIEVKLT